MCIVYRAQLSFLRQIYYVKVFFDILEFRFHKKYTNLVSDTKLGKAKKRGKKTFEICNVFENVLRNILDINLCRPDVNRF